MREWDGRLACRFRFKSDGRDARPTLLPAAYFDRNEGHAISGTGHSLVLTNEIPVAALGIWPQADGT